ncbi:mdt-9 family protein [Megaselia abdita]
MSAEKATLDSSKEVVDCRNKNKVRCQFCNSLMLKPKAAMFIEKQVSEQKYLNFQLTFIAFQFKLPLIHQKNSVDIKDVETEEISEYWVVNDMLTFENIGFSNQVENTKFLTCADCEKGPVGFNIASEKNCYIALSRVKHVE